jgi:lysozyme
MRLSENGLRELKESEAFRAHAYQDSAGVWTIGYGSTFYKDGRRVAKGDMPITEPEAVDLLMHVFEKNFARVVPDNVNQNQYDALASFVYNVGAKSFERSTLKKKVLKNPDDTSISDEFLKWNKITVNGEKVVVKGLTIRRKRESKLYFTPV